MNFDVCSPPTELAQMLSVRVALQKWNMFTFSWLFVLFRCSAKVNIHKVEYKSDVTVLTSSQINKEDGIVEATRIMNLYQFIQLYRDITSQAAGVLSAEGVTEGPSAQLPSTDSCQASMWMGRSVHSDTVFTLVYILNWGLLFCVNHRKIFWLSER